MIFYFLLLFILFCFVFLLFFVFVFFCCFYFLNEYFCVLLKIFCGYLGGGGAVITKLDYFSSHFFVFRVFLRSNDRMGMFLGYAKLSSIFGVCRTCLMFFKVNSKCWGQAYM